jgi:acetyl esterase/lipase
VSTAPERLPAPEAADASGLYRIWPGDGSAPGSEDWSWSESTMQAPWVTLPRRLSRNVVIPTLTVFEPAPGKANGTSMIIAPGGAFHFLMVDHEGYDMARWLAGLGVTAFVLKYRVARTPDADDELLAFRNALQARLAAKAQPGEDRPPDNDDINAARLLGEEDGRQAIRFVRQHAATWGLDPNRIGISGFSAGGGVCIGAALEHDASSRPDYVVGVYPAWRGSLAMPDNAPPLFLIISDDDRAVPALSSVRLYEMWHRAGVPVEFHIFGNGGHGWGFAEAGFLSDPWPSLLQNWMKTRGLLG